MPPGTETYTAGVGAGGEGEGVARGLGHVCWFPLAQKAQRFE